MIEFFVELGGILTPKAFVEICIVGAAFGMIVVGFGFMFQSLSIKKRGGALTLFCFTAAYTQEYLMLSGIVVPPWVYVVIFVILGLMGVQSLINILFGKAVGVHVISYILIHIYKLLMAVLFGPIELMRKIVKGKNFEE